MKVLFVNHTARLGGAERSLLELMTALKGSTDCALFTFEEGPLTQAVRELGLEVSTFSEPDSLTNFSRQRALKKPWELISVLAEGVAITKELIAFSKSCGATVLHANSVKAPPFVLVASKILKIPAICHLRDIYPPKFPFTFLLMMMHRFSRKVVCNSITVSQQFPPSPRVVVVYNGLDPEKIKAAIQGIDRAAIRAQLGLTENEKFLILVGRLQNWKGQDIAIKAMAKLEKTTHLFLVGTGLEQENTENNLRSLCKESGVEERVHFLGERQDALALMAVSDLVLHTSREPEPFGRVVLEAMMIGVPVIASDEGGPKEMIQNGVNGLLVKPGQPGELKAAIERVFADPIGAQKMVVEAKITAEKRFSLSRVISELQTIWQ